MLHSPWFPLCARQNQEGACGVQRDLGKLVGVPRSMPGMHSRLLDLQSRRSVHKLGWIVCRSHFSRCKCLDVECAHVQVSVYCISVCVLLRGRSFLPAERIPEQVPSRLQPGIRKRRHVMSFTTSSSHPERAAEPERGASCPASKGWARKYPALRSQIHIQTHAAQMPHWAPESIVMYTQPRWSRM